MKTTEFVTTSQKQEFGPFQRRRTAVLPKRSWVQRNPRIFSITFITSSLLILFSKPIYDNFFAEQLPPQPGTTALSRRNTP